MMTKKNVTAPDRKFSLMEIKQILLDAKTIGSEKTKVKWGIKSHQLTEFCHAYPEWYYKLHLKERTLQDEVQLLKHKGYTSVEAAKTLNQPIEVVNDLWVFIK